MNHSGLSVDEFFQQAAARGQPLVLATIVETVGWTYRKAGAQMLAAADGSAAGLLSGGCLESRFDGSRPFRIRNRVRQKSSTTTLVVAMI